MPKKRLPVFSEQIGCLNYRLTVSCRDGWVTYFAGFPVFTHAVDDEASFRMITSQFCVEGETTPADIVRVFGVSESSVRRGVRLYREKGSDGFRSA